MSWKKKAAGFTIKIRSRIIIKAFQPYIKAGDKVLDIGCGDGLMGDELRSYFKCDMSGTDVMDYCGADIPYTSMARPDKLPFTSGSFDAAVMVDMLHHMPYESQAELIKEAARVARSKVLIIDVRPTLVCKIFDYLINKIHNKDMPVPLTMRDVDEWRRIFETLGLKPEIKLLPKPFFAYPFQHICIAAASR